MTDAERDELRALQDRYLGLHAVMRFTAERGDQVPLWAGGPTAAEIKATLLPAWKYAFEVEIHNHAKGG